MPAISAGIVVDLSAGIVVDLSAGIVVDLSAGIVADDSSMVDQGVFQGKKRRDVVRRVLCGLKAFFFEKRAIYRILV